MDLSSIFSWRPTTDPAALNHRFLSIVANDLNVALNECAQQFGDKDGDMARTALARLRALPDAGLVRVLEAPETFYWVSRLRAERPMDFVRAVHVWVDAEQARADSAFVPNGPSWSALGDAYFPAGVQRRQEAPVRYDAPLVWSEDETFAAPLLHESLVLDFFSPHAAYPLKTAAHRAVQLGPATLLNVSQCTQIRDLVREALSQIGQAASQAFDFVKTVSRVIMPRQDAKNPNLFTSVSTREFIGRTILINPHLPDTDVAVISGAVIHEAIHDFLYMYELESPLFTDMSAIPGGSFLRSPWSGGTLAVQQYIHACFVWYGLLQFWRSPGAAACYASERVRKHRERAEVGFRHRIIEPLEPFRSRIGADWFEQIAELRA